MPKKTTTFVSLARHWSTQHKLHGPQAFLRYVILTYVDAVNQVSKDFVFKGGNLLWMYVQTPRGTVDLDFATLSIERHEKVKKVLEAASRAAIGITFKLKTFERVVRKEAVGGHAIIEYQTEQGATNQFEIDIVYNQATDVIELESLIHPNQSIQAASLENIIADKLAALHRFGSGNTRIKDIDDLYRLANSSVPVNRRKLRRLCKQRKLPAAVLLKEEWITPQMERAWQKQARRYKDLPPAIVGVFKTVNLWLAKFLL